MNLEFDINALQDIKYWVKIDKKKAEKILKLVEEVLKTPFEETGKPKALKHSLAGCWSRRIDQEHRIVYQVTSEKIRILACRFHY